MNGLGFQRHAMLPHDLLDALGGLAGGGAEGHAKARLAEGPGQARHHERLPRAGAAGDHGDAAGKRRAVGVPLAGIEVVGAGGVGQGLGGLPRVGLERVEDELLGLQHRRRGHRRPVRDDVAARQEPVGCGPHEVPAVEGVEDEDRAGLLQEVAPGRPRVTAAGFLGQAVPQRRLQPARVVLGHSHLAGDLVDPLETVAGDVLDDAVRVLPEDADDALAERLQQHRGLVMRQAEAGQVRADLVLGGMGNPRVA